MLPPKIKAALIDMDGVLYDSMPLHAKAWRKMMLEETGLDLPEALFFEYEGMTGHATIAKIFREQLDKEITAKECSRLYAIKTEYFRQNNARPIMKGAPTAMRVLKDNHIRCVLVTGSGQKSLIDQIASDYPGVFNEGDMVTAMDVAHGKPHPEPYMKGLAKACTNPSETIVIENAPLGIISGKAAGCHVCAVATGPIPFETLKAAGADEIYADMNALAEALRTHKMS